MNIYSYILFYFILSLLYAIVSQENCSLFFHQRPLVKATSIRNPAFLPHPTRRIKDEGALSLLFYFPVLRHSRSIISAQERNLAVPRRMQLPPRTGLIVRNKEKNNGVPISPASFIRPVAVDFSLTVQK